MGEELPQQKVTSQGESQFTYQDEVEFKRRLKAETDLLKTWFLEDRFVDEDNHFGMELEGVLLDQDHLPAPKNQAFLANANNKNLVPEIAQFNFEINSHVHTLSPQLLSSFHSELKNWMQQCRGIAKSLESIPVWIGTLPTLRETELRVQNMTPSNRYYALAKRLLEFRKGQKGSVKISRFDRLEFEQEDVMLESAATSVQFHTQVRPKRALATYVAAQWISGPMVALCANSPFLFGQKLWDETRIAVFEQAVALSPYTDQNIKDPVTFGSKWPVESLHDVFVSNLQYPVFLPVQFDAPPEQLKHLKLLNGQIWRWNRVIIGTGEGGAQPHIRIEHRPLPAGPTAIDTVGNFAVYLGLLHSFADEILKNGINFYDFETAKANFYQCAKQGFKADVCWDGKIINVQTLLHTVLIPKARQYLLDHLNLDMSEVRYYLDEVMTKRSLTGWNGAAWQKSYIDLKGRDFQGLVKTYVENQETDQPICSWKI